jgi:hypothetical protein
MDKETLFLHAELAACNAIETHDMVVVARSLFEIAETSKKAGIYGPANTVFALLMELDSVLEEGRIGWEYETDDGDSYYDLPVIVGLGDLDGHRLCIPGPLLSRDGIIIALRKAMIVERRQHDREILDLPEEDKGELEKHLHQMLEDIWDKVRERKAVDRMEEVVPYFLNPSV